MIRRNFRLHYLLVVLSLSVLSLTALDSCDSPKAETPSQQTGQVDEKAPDFLKADEYEIMVNDTRHANVKNFHVWMKKPDFDSLYVYSFIDKFRAEYCSGKCNVSVYDSDKVKDLVLKYPIEGDEYVLLADHFVSSSDFAYPSMRDWYPYQDWNYSKQRGKNWKKKPIQRPKS